VVHYEFEPLGEKMLKHYPQLLSGGSRGHRCDDVKSFSWQLANA
jgi:hypothetical protein